MFDLTDPRGVMLYMASASSESDWNKKCDEVKAANYDEYPAFWHQVMVASGLMSMIQSEWDVN